MVQHSIEFDAQEALLSLPHVTQRPIFGGMGFFTNARPFAVYKDGAFYFRTGNSSIALYLSMGQGPMLHSVQGEPHVLSFYSVPPAILKDPGGFVHWANMAIKETKAQTADRQRSALLRKKTALVKPKPQTFSPIGIKVQAT